MIKACIRDKTCYWSFIITEKEYECVQSGELQVFWDNRVLHKKEWIEVKPGKKKVKVNVINDSGWCLVTKEQRARLLDWKTGSLDVWVLNVFRNEGSRGLSEVSSIKWLKHEENREYKRVRRKPILSIKPKY